jgi:hypothetical protein
VLVSVKAVQTVYGLWVCFSGNAGNDEGKAVCSVAFIRKKVVRAHGGLRGERGERVKRAKAPMQREVRGNEQMQRDVRRNAPHDGLCR